MTFQTSLFDQTKCTAEKFDDWKKTDGGRRVLQMAYAIAARYARRFKNSGRRVSMMLIWEMLRDNVAAVHSKRIALKLHKVDGFALNNNFRSFTAKHIISRRPEWDGLFEFRETK